MGSESNETHEVTMSVEVAPIEPLVAADVTVEVAASCDRGCDLSGTTLLVRDDDGRTIGNAALGAVDEGVHGATVRLAAPSTPGSHRWTVVMSPAAGDGARHGDAQASVGFTTQPHPTLVEVWQVPYGAPPGEAFTIKVGIKCVRGCSMTGAPFSVVDERGDVLARGSVGPAIWPGTKALHHADVRLVAPDAEGRARWAVTVADTEGPLAHTGARHDFGVTAVAPPEYRVVVEAFDRERQEPIRGMNVVMHPFRATTDEHGVASLRVAPGSYKLFVSGFNYITYSSSVEITGDMTTRADLETEPELNLHEYR